MASRILMVYESGAPVGRTSSTETFDFASIKIGADAMEISQSGSGGTAAFDFAGKKLKNTAAGAATGDAVEYDQLNTALALKVSTSTKGQANGVASLDGAGKIPNSQLPASAMEFKGAWNASSNTPTLNDVALKASRTIQDVKFAAKTAGAAGNSITVEYIDTASGGLSFTEVGTALTIDFGGATPDADTVAALAFTLVDATVTGTGSNVQTAPVALGALTGGQDQASAGDVYRVSASGTQNLGSGSISFILGDLVMYSGTIWERSPLADGVESVNTKTGSVTLYTDDISEDGTPVNLWFTEARVRASVLTGFSSATGGAIVATDTVLEAFGKTENRMALNDAKVGYTATAARSDLIASSIVDGVTDHAPDSNSVFDALAGKSDTSHNHTGVYDPAGTAAGLIEDQIVDGVTTKAPSQNAVFDALAGKSDTSHNHSGVYDPAGTAAAIIASSITNGDTTHSPSGDAVYDALALKADSSAIWDGTKQLENDTASEMTIGQIVYLKSNGKVGLADKSTTGNVLLGVVMDATIAAAASGKISIQPGKLLATFGSLTVGSMYFLGTGGAVTTTATTTSGDKLIEIGVAYSGTEIMVNPKYILSLA